MTALATPLPLDSFANRIADIRREVIAIDSIVLSPAPGERARAAIIRASAYIWSSASLEAYVKDELAHLAALLNSTAIPFSGLRLSLLSLQLRSELDSSANIRGLKKFKARAELLERVNHSAAAALDSGALPLDGRTLRPQHFDAIWYVYGFDGSPLPTPRHALALRDLAENRNDLAHGRVDPLTFGRRKTTADILRLLAAVEDVAENLYLATDRFVVGQRYLR